MSHFLRRLSRPRCAPFFSLLLAACTSNSDGGGATESGSTTTGSAATTGGAAATGSTQADETGSSTTAQDTTGGSSSESSTGEGSTTGPAPSLPEDLATELSVAWACDDISVHLANPERTIMLTFVWPGRLAEAEKATVEVTYEVTFNGEGTDDIELRVEQGSNLDSSTCQSTSADPVILENTWDASGGFARITTWPAWLSPAGTIGSARVLFTSLEVTRRSDEQTFAIPDFEREDIPVLP